LKCARPITGVPSPTDNSIVNFVREGARRILGTSQTNRKQPLTIEQLNLMISRANLNNTLELCNVCMYSLAFVGLLRFDDLIRIKRCDLSFSSDHLTIVIAKSKNDRLRKGNEVLISETASPTSSIKLLELGLEFRFLVIATNIYSGLLLNLDLTIVLLKTTSISVSLPSGTASNLI
jgi:hypothetical protein